MKSIIICMILSICYGPTHAQFLGSLFSQKKENRKRLAEQIVALKVYKEYLEKGYSIARKGLNTINDIKTGDFHLHRDFLNALKKVNPKVKKYSKVADLIALNLKTIAYQKEARKLSQADLFNQEESQYFGRVLARIIEGLSLTLDELMVIITDNQLELKDDERLLRIDKLYEEADEQYRFIRSFAANLIELKANREKEQADITAGMMLNGLQ